MWIYQQNTLTSQSAALEQEVTALAVQPDHHPNREAERPAEPVVLRRKQRFIGTKEFFLLAIAILSGSAASGVVRALCNDLQLAWLDAYLTLWLDGFSVPGTHSMALFAAGYFTLAGAATFLLLSGFSAFGPALISLFLMLYGTGNGLLMLHLLNGTSWKEKLLVILFTALPSSIAESCLCILSASALRVSEKLREYSFRRNIPAKSRLDTGILVRQYVLTLVLFVPLCGAASGMACIESRLF